MASCIYFSQIVSNDNDDEDDTNNFGDKHYKLIVDIIVFTIFSIVGMFSIFTSDSFSLR